MGYPRVPRPPPRRPHVPRRRGVRRVGGGVVPECPPGGGRARTLPRGRPFGRARPNTKPDNFTVSEWRRDRKALTYNNFGYADRPGEASHGTPLSGPPG